MPINRISSSKKPLTPSGRATFEVESESAMLALTRAQTGDIAVRTDLSRSFRLQGRNPEALDDWQELLAASGSGLTEIADNSITDAKIGVRTIAGLSKTLSDWLSWLTNSFDTVSLALSNHSRSPNPHGTTAEQVGAIPLSQRGAANGVAELVNGKVPIARLPAGSTGGSGSSPYVNAVENALTEDGLILLFADAEDTILGGWDANGHWHSYSPQSTIDGNLTVAGTLTANQIQGQANFNPLTIGGSELRTQEADFLTEFVAGDPLFAVTDANGVAMLAATADDVVHIFSKLRVQQTIEIDGAATFKTVTMQDAHVQRLHSIGGAQMEDLNLLGFPLVVFTDREEHEVFRIDANGQHSFRPADYWLSSEDGTRYFSTRADGQIWSRDAATGALTQLTTQGRNQITDVKAGQVLFSSDRAGDWALWRMNLNGASQTAAP